jgi:hypothetical protein
VTATPARLPVLGLVARPGEGEDLRPLVRDLTAWCEVRALRDLPHPPDAVLATSPAALAQIPYGWHGPVALWLEAPEHLAPPAELTSWSPLVVVTESAELATEVGVDALLVGGPLTGFPDRQWVPPLLRRRWRERRQLPPDLVVDTSVDHDESLLAVAAAAVVDFATLPLALALGTPCVTTTTAAAALHLSDGRDVIVEDSPAGARRRAEELAADETTASRLSRAGSSTARERSPRHVARALARRLGLLTLDDSQWHRAMSRLDDLGLPPGSPVRQRVLDAFAPFEHALPIPVTS